MAYNENIPQPGDQLSQSQADILANFMAIQTLIDVNHVDFANGADQGKHKFVTFPVQGSAPSFSAGEVGLYNLSYATTSTNELFFNSQNGTNIPATASILSTSSAPARNTVGWTYLPSGILMQWGNFSAVSGLQTVTVTTADFPAFNNMLSVMVCPYNASAGDVDFAVRLGAILSTTQFQVYVSSRTGTGPALGGFQYLVIGY